jgi:hypothetical protein
MTKEMLDKFIPPALQEKYDFYSYGHALEILHTAFFQEWLDLRKALDSFYVKTEDIILSGGNKSPIPKRFDKLLFPFAWREVRITGDLVVKKYVRSGIRTANTRPGPTDEFLDDEITLKGYIDGHNIDYIKNKVAFDLEWNSKDQTFDRDLLAMRTYFDCGIIDVGVIVTRAENLNDTFDRLTETGAAGLGMEIKRKYGASTTHIDKLLPRLDSRRQGGCPILAIGITNKCVVD